MLDSKESSLKAALQDLECERGKERALQSRLEEEQLQHLQKEGQNSKTLEVPGQRGGGSSPWGPSPALPAGTCRAAGSNSGEAGLCPVQQYLRLDRQRP